LNQELSISEIARRTGCSHGTVRKYLLSPALSPSNKGKIEEQRWLVKRDFLIGSEFHSFSDLNLQAQSWLARMNSTVRGSTNEIPAERFAKEGLQIMI